MKRIINSKMYNTETATYVAYYSNGVSRSDFGYCAESLYRKKTGEYFLAGNGGAASKYSRQCGGNSWAGGEGIIPLTMEEAREWAERAMEADAYIAEFGEPEE